MRTPMRTLEHKFRGSLVAVALCAASNWVLLLAVASLLLPAQLADARHVVVEPRPHSRKSSNTSIPQIDFPSLGQVAALGSFSGLDIYRASAASHALGPARIDPQRSTLFARSPSGLTFPAGATDQGGQIHAVCSLHIPDNQSLSAATGSPRTDPKPVLLDPQISTAPPFLDAAAPLGPGAKGQVVFVAGNFTAIGNISAQNIARWHPEDGTWSSLQNGINGTVHALLCSSSRKSVVVGGNFPAPNTVASSSSSSHSGSSTSASPSSSQANVNDYAGHVALWDVSKGLWSPPSFGGLNAPVYSLNPGISNTSHILFTGNFSLSWSTYFLPTSGTSSLKLSPATAASNAWTFPVALGSDPLTGLLPPIPWGNGSLVTGTASSVEGYGSSSVVRCPSGPDGPGSTFLLADGSGGGSLTINFGGAAEVRALRLSNTYVNGSSTTSFHVTPSSASGTDATTGTNSPPTSLSWAYVNPATGTGANCSSTCPLPRWPGVPYTDYLLINATDQYGIPSVSTMAGLTITFDNWSGSAPGLHSVQALGPGGVVSADSNMNAVSSCASQEPGASGTSPWLSLFSTQSDSQSSTGSWNTEKYNAQTLQAVAGSSSNTSETYSYFLSKWSNASIAQFPEEGQRVPAVRAEYYPSVLAAGNYSAYMRVPPCSRTPDAGGCLARTTVNVSVSVPAYAPANIPASTHWAVLDQNLTSLTTVAVWSGELGPRTSANASTGPVFTLSLANTAQAPNGTNENTNNFAILADRLTLTLQNSTAAPAATVRSTGILEYDPWDTSLFGFSAHWPPSAQGNNSAALPAQLGSVADRVGGALTAAGVGRQAAQARTSEPSVLGLTSVPAQHGVRDRVVVTGQFDGAAATLPQGGASNNQSSVDIASANVTSAGRGQTFANLAVWSAGAPGGNISSPITEASSITGSLLSPLGLGLSNPSVGALLVPTTDGSLVFLAGNFAATSDGNIYLPRVTAYNVSSDAWVAIPTGDPLTFNASANGGNATRPPLGLGGSIESMMLAKHPDAPGGGTPIVGFLGALQLPDLAGTGLSVGAQLVDETNLAVNSWGGQVFWNITGATVSVPAASSDSSRNPRINGTATVDSYSDGSWLPPTNLLTANMTAGHGFDLRTGLAGAWERFPYAMVSGPTQTLADTLAPASALVKSSAYAASDQSLAGVTLASLNFSFVPPSLMYTSITNKSHNGSNDRFNWRRSEIEQTDDHLLALEENIKESPSTSETMPPWTASGDVRLNISALIPSSSNDDLAVVRTGVYWTPMWARNDSTGSGSSTGSSSGNSDHYVAKRASANSQRAEDGGWMSGLHPTVVQGSEPALLIIGGNFTSARNVSNLGLYDPTSQTLLPFPPLPFDVGAGLSDGHSESDDGWKSKIDSGASDSSSTSDGPDWSTTQAYLMSEVHALTVVNQTLFVGATGGLLIFDLYNGAWLENVAPLSRSPVWVPTRGDGSDDGDGHGDGYGSHGYDSGNAFGGGYLLEKPVIVRKLLPKPGAEIMVVVGEFDSAGSLPCASICLWDFTGGGPSGRWMQLGTGFTGQVVDVDFADDDAEVLVVAGALTIREQEAALAMWSLYNGTWRAFGSVGPEPYQIPGPATAVVVNDLALNSIFVAGVSVFNQSIPTYDGGQESQDFSDSGFEPNPNFSSDSSSSDSTRAQDSRSQRDLAVRRHHFLDSTEPPRDSSMLGLVRGAASDLRHRAWPVSYAQRDQLWPGNQTSAQPFLVKWDGTQFINLGAGALVGGTITELGILPILTAGPKTNIIQDNRVLSIMGQININNSGPVAAVLHDGERWIPFITALGPSGDPGVILSLVRQNLRVTFANLHQLSQGEVVAIAVFMSLGIVILLVILGSVLTRLFPSTDSGATLAARDSAFQLHSQSPAMSATRVVGTSTVSLSNASMSTSPSPAVGAVTATGMSARRAWAQSPPIRANWGSHLGTPNSGLRARLVRPKMTRRKTDQTGAPSILTTGSSLPRRDPSGSVLARLSDENPPDTREEIQLSDLSTPRPVRTSSLLPEGPAGARDPLSGVPATPLPLSRDIERERDRDPDRQHRVDQERKTNEGGADQSPPPAPSKGMDLLAQLNAATEKVIRADSGEAEGEDNDAEDEREDDWDPSPYNSDEDEAPPPLPTQHRHPQDAVPMDAMTRAMQTFRHNQHQFDIATSEDTSPSPLTTAMVPQDAHPLREPMKRAGGIGEQHEYGGDYQSAHPNPTMEGLLDKMELANASHLPQDPIRHARDLSQGTNSTTLGKPSESMCAYGNGLVGHSTTSFAQSLPQSEWVSPPFPTSRPLGPSIALQRPNTSQPTPAEAPPPVAHLMPTLRPFWTGGYTPTTPFVAYVRTRYAPPSHDESDYMDRFTSTGRKGMRRPSQTKVDWAPGSLTGSSVVGSIRTVGPYGLRAELGLPDVSGIDTKWGASSGMPLYQLGPGGDMGTAPHDSSRSSGSEPLTVHAGQEVEIISDHDPTWWVARDSSGRMGALPVSILVT